MAELKSLVIPASAYAAMRDEVVRWSPEEACGMAAGKPGEISQVIPVANRLHSPVRFEMDPLEQLRGFQAIDAADLELIAIYHSHPQGPAHPSVTDIAEFAYPGVVYLIWAHSPGDDPGSWSVRGFDLDTSPFREVPMIIR